MKNLYRSLLGLSLVGAAYAVTGCSGESDVTESVADVDVDTISEEDWGRSYNRWHILAGGTNRRNSAVAEFYVTFARSGGGDATRGGGGCIVKRRVGSSCTADSQCIVPDPGWGYCAYGECWDRLGHQGSHCALGPSHGPTASYNRTVNVPLYNNDDYAVMTCLTKAAGPNYACGGSDASLYMRDVQHLAVGD